MKTLQFNLNSQGFLVLSDLANGKLYHPSDFYGNFLNVEPKRTFSRSYSFLMAKRSGRWILFRNKVWAGLPMQLTRPQVSVHPLLVHGQPRNLTLPLNHSYKQNCKLNILLCKFENANSLYKIQRARESYLQPKKLSLELQLQRLSVRSLIWFRGQKKMKILRLKKS